MITLTNHDDTRKNLITVMMRMAMVKWIALIRHPKSPIPLK